MNSVLFTGHRIDSGDRKETRFPPEAEPIARAVIWQVLAAESRKAPLIGFSGGANGGDILFLEVCRELEIPFQILLALPEPDFIRKSVAPAGANWVARFQALAAMSKPHVMPDNSSQGLWARSNRWMIESALAPKPKDFILLALWDGATGDGPGGTEDMVATARQNGARFIHLDTRKLFIRTARP
jgi:hypothetical protein